MKRILIFSTTYFPLVGGAEVALKEITDRLPDWQCDLVCARIRPGLLSVEKVGNVTVHRCGFGHPIDKYLLPIWGAIRATFIAPASDVAGIWSMMASYGGFTALCYTWLRPRTRWLLSLQEGDPLEHYAKRTGWLTFLHKNIFARADAVQAISHFLADWSKKMGFKGVPMVIPNGVDIEKFTQRVARDTQHRSEARHALGLGDNDLALITTGRLTLKNGADDLIRSLAFLPTHVKALIVGDGEDREKLHALTKEKKVEGRVLFLGLRGHDELPGLLQASDIFVRAALSEGLGNSFLEAMAAGLPIVGTPVGGIPDFLTDGETGVFCRPRDPESIADAVKRLQSEPGLRQKLIVNGERLVRERYDWNRVAKQMDQLLQSLTRV